MRKRIFALLTALVLGLSFSACAKNTEKNVSKKDREELADTDVVFSYDDPSEYITIPDDYIGIEVSKPQEVTEEEIQQQIEYARYAHMKTEEIKEGTLKEGDTVHIHSEGKLKGAEKPFESSEYDVSIGRGEMIPGFEEGLVGAKVGDTVQLELPFPEEYSNSDLAGKEAVFTVVIDYICGEEYLADWTDEFVQEITEGKYKNVVDYKAELKKQLQEEKDKETFYAQQGEMINYLVEKSVVHKYPKGLVETQYDNFLKEYEEEFEKANEENMTYSSLEVYVLIELGYSNIQEFYDDMQKNAEKAVTEHLVYQAIAYKENLTLTKEEYEYYLQSLASTYGYTNASKFEELYMNAYEGQDEDFLYKKFLDQKVVEFLQSQAKIAA